MKPLMIDVREFPEYAGGHIEGAVLVPLGSLEERCQAWDRDTPITLVCRSGRRAEQARHQLAAHGFTRLDVLAGGTEAWRAAGRPLLRGDRRPWSLERQVRLIAGGLVLLTLALGVLVSRYFLALTAFVGAGLTFAGLTDLCLMASLLGRLPWNRAPHEGTAQDLTAGSCSR